VILGVLCKSCCIAQGLLLQLYARSARQNVGLLAVACMGDQISGLDLRAWHCLYRGIRRHAIRFWSLGEHLKAMVLCGTVSRQHDMSAVTVFSRTCQMCHLAAFAASRPGACRLKFLQKLVGGGGPWDSCSLEPYAA